MLVPKDVATRTIKGELKVKKGFYAVETKTKTGKTRTMYFTEKKADKEIKKKRKKKSDEIEVVENQILDIN